MGDHPVGHTDGVSRIHGRSYDAALGRKLRPGGRSIELKDSIAQEAVRVRAGDILPLRLALDELFDGRAIFYRKRHGIRPAVAT
jgi:hypothetical protein